MGKGQLAVIHASDRIEWHDRYAEAFREGLGRIGIRAQITRETQRVSEAPAICLGTTLWRSIEADELPHLLVDRCSFGDPNDVVTLTWNGKGMRGNPVVPGKGSDPVRWLSFDVKLATTAPQFDGETVLCGQTESFCPDYDRIEDWYAEWERLCTHFRPHPANPERPKTLMPADPTWRKVSTAVVLNSSVAIDAIIAGVPNVFVMDAGSLAWRWNRRFATRYDFLIWLSWTQWRIEEIRDGKAIQHIFRKAAARRVRSGM